MSEIIDSALIKYINVNQFAFLITDSSIGACVVYLQSTYNIFVEMSYSLTRETG